MDLDEAAKVFREFVAIVKALRTPGTGCPWDLEQDHQTLRPYLIEEAYEVLDAIDRGNDRALREELGDLLLQVVLHAQVAEDRGAFTIGDVVGGIAEKMVRRHPHVFGSVRVNGSAEVLRNWEKIKAEEQQAQGETSSPAAALERLPEALPALLCAQRLDEKAAKIHGDQPPLAAVFTAVREELARLEAECQRVSASGVLENRLGDLLFGLTQLGRRLGLSAEDSLRACNRRFIERVRDEARGEDPSNRDSPGRGDHG